MLAAIVLYKISKYEISINIQMIIDTHNKNFIKTTEGPSNKTKR
jgi:hypothetical protein